MSQGSHRVAWIVLVGMCGAVLGTCPVFAKAKSQKDPGKHLEYLDKKLELTDEQRVQVERALNDYHTRAEALSEQWQALRREKHDKIAAILTAEQQATFEKMGKKGHHKSWWSRKKHGQDD